MIAATLLLACGDGGGRDAGEDAAVCGDDLAVFEAQVWEPALESTCLACHGPGGPGSEASALDLDPDDLAASLASTVDVVDRLLAKPTGEVEHGGGAVLAPGSDAYAALAFWVGWVNGDDCDVPEPLSCADADATRLLRRLTHDEYAASVFDVLGVVVDPGSFAADVVVDGFRNDAEALVVGDLLADQYRSTAEDVGAELEPYTLVACDRAALGDAACAAMFVDEVGFALFRRPLGDDELAAWGALWTELAAEDGADEALRWVLVGMLQSPNFLYRSELGEQGAPGAFTLTKWELATALSYGILGTTPDRALLDRVSDGLLADPDDVGVVAAELLADPRALGTAADLAEVWLDLVGLDTVSREGLTPELRDAMRLEARGLVEELAGGEGTLSDLLDADVLTLPAVLTAHGRPLGSGPVQRGVFVRERLLCEDLPPPPSNLDTSPPEVDPASSTREQYATHSSDPACSGCHDKIDPLGFAFEHYDELGQWRDDDNGHPIDDAGDVDGVTFTGPDGLASALLDEARFRTCFVTTWRRHVTGRPACGDDPGSDVGLLAPLAALDWSLVRVGGPDEGDTLATGDRVAPEVPEEPDELPASDALQLTVVDDWGAGWCGEGEVTNNTGADWVWTVSTPADGALDNVWNATAVEAGEDWVFVGVDWNATLAPGASTTFGFCATR